MSWLIFALCEQFWKIQIFGPLFAQNWVPFLQFLGPLEIVYQWRCRGISYYKIYLTVSRYIIYERARDSLAESIKDMHMIHCKYPNRAQQSSEGRIKNLGLGSKIRTFLGPFWRFGPIWDQVPNSGPYWSACIPFFQSDRKSWTLKYILQCLVIFNSNS